MWGLSYGIVTIERAEQECVDIILENHPGDAWVYTNDKYSFLDGMFVRGGVIKAVAEIKSRECAFGTHKKEMLNWNKLEAGQWASRSFRCPFYLFSYHATSDLVACYQVTNNVGEFVRKFEISDYGQNRSKENRESKTVRKTVWLESEDPNLIKRCGRRCIF